MKYLILRIISVCLLFIISNKSYPQQEFQKSLIVPIAYGQIEIEEVDRKEYAVDVRIERLTKASNINKRKPIYMVWAISKKDTSKLGVLRRKEDMAGELKSQFTMERDPQHIAITVERSERAKGISSDIILISEELEL